MCARTCRPRERLWSRGAACELSPPGSAVFKLGAPELLSLRYLCSKLQCRLQASLYVFSLTSFAPLLSLKIFCRLTCLPLFSLSRARARALSLSFSLSLSLSFSLSLSLLALSLASSLSLSLSLARSLARSLSLFSRFLPLARAVSLARALSLSLTHSLARSLFLSRTSRFSPLAPADTALFPISCLSSLSCRERGEWPGGGEGSGGRGGAGCLRQPPGPQLATDGGFRIPSRSPCPPGTTGGPRGVERRDRERTEEKSRRQCRQGSNRDGNPGHIAD